MRTVINLIIVLLCLSYNVSSIAAQTLYKTISVNYQQERLGKILNDMSEKYKLNLSYSNNQLPLELRYTLKMENQTIGKILEEICAKAGLTYQAIGTHIVITKKADAPKVQPTKKSEPMGMQKKEEQMSSIAYLTSYPTHNMQIDQVQLRKSYLVEKKKILENYDSKVDSLDRASANMTMKEWRLRSKILMMGLQKEIQILKKQLKESAASYKKQSPKNIDSTQVRDTIFTKTETLDTVKYERNWQISLVPPISTNGREASKYTNKASYNIIAGYSNSLNGVEYGWVANVEKSNMTGAQFTSGANVVGNSVKGAQFAAICNIVGGYTKGAQFAGIANLTADSADAFQAAGIINVVDGNLYGAQFAGITNTANGNMTGLQAAGILNTANGELYGTQLAGILNTATDSVRGNQFAGIANISADHVNGMQLASIVNVAKSVRGLQMGLINIADSVTGTQIGLISIARNGYRRLEIFASESWYGNVAFKMGTPSFYNIFAVGVRPEKSTVYWGFGYGAGTEFRVAGNTKFNIDILCYQIINKIEKNQDLNLLNQAKFNISFLLGKRTRLFVGPVLNVKVARKIDPLTNQVGRDMVSWNLLDKTHNGTNVTLWPGIHAGLRF